MCVAVTGPGYDADSISRECSISQRRPRTLCCRTMASRRFRTAVVLAALLWVPEVVLGYVEGCTTFVTAQQGDTCVTLATLAGISVTQFIRNNPTVTGCDQLVVGDNYCVEQARSTSSAATPKATTTPVPGGLQASTDGQCGGGFTCTGSDFGKCCSEHGWCGDSEVHCGPKCQQPFGKCADQGPSNPSSSITPPTGGNGTTVKVTITITETVKSTTTSVIQSTSTILATSVVTAPTTRTVSATVTVPTTVAGSPTTRVITTTYTVSTTVGGVVTTRVVSTTLTVPATVTATAYATRTVSNIVPGPPTTVEVSKTVTVISAVRTTQTVAVTTTATSVWERTRTETETETATETITHNVFRTITIINTETETATTTATVPVTRTTTVISKSIQTEVVPTTVYRTQTQTLYATATVTALPRTATITQWDTITKLETITNWSTRTTTQYAEVTLMSYRTINVVTTTTVNVAVPVPTTTTVTLLRTVTMAGGQGTTTVTLLKTVSLGNAVTVVSTMTVFKTITAPAAGAPGGCATVTRTRTVTQCDDYWMVGPS